MTENVLNKNRNGMAMLLILLGGILGGLIGAGLCISASPDNGFLGFAAVVLFLIAAVCLFLLSGLKILKPQEALVLTLFGKYIHPEGRRLLLGQSLLLRREPRRRNHAEPERRRKGCPA